MKFIFRSKAYNLANSADANISAADLRRDDQLEINMKGFFRAFCLVLICLAAVTANCAESYRTHLEVTVEDGAGKAGAGGPFDVVSGVPLMIDIGDKSLSLLFSIEPSPSIEYSLTVSLSPKQNSTRASTMSLSQKATSTHASSIPLLSQTFHSRLVGGETGPLEFEMEQNGFKVSGVVALSLIHNDPN